MTNFFSKILGRNVVYPDFTMEKTQDWWLDAIERFFFTDAVVKFDGIFLVSLKQPKVFNGCRINLIVYVSLKGLFNSSG